MQNKQSTVMNGSNQWWGITHAARTGMDITGNISMRAGFNLSALADTSNYVLASIFNNVVGEKAFIFKVKKLSGVASIQFIPYNSSSVADNSYIWDLTALIATDTYFIIDFTWNATSSTGKLYLNGAQFGSDIVGTNTDIDDTTADFRIGALSLAGETQFFPGKIDIFGMWNVERSAVDIAADFNTVLNRNEPGLVAYYLFDSNGNDETSNSNDLTANNSPTYSGLTAFKNNAIVGM